MIPPSTMLKACVCTAIVRSGGLALFRRLSPRRPTVLLMYHHINDAADPLGLSISPSFFVEQIRYLLENHRIISLGQAVSEIERGGNNRGGVVLTFDDGYRDNYDAAFPILRQYQCPATIFVTCDAVASGTFHWTQFDSAVLSGSRPSLDLTEFGLGRFDLEGRKRRERVLVELHRRLKSLPDADRQEIVAAIVRSLGDGGSPCRAMLSWEEVREMQQSGLITIGSHTLSHRILTRVSSAAARAEIQDSKRVLEENTGHPVEFFAYPNGGPSDFSPEIAEMVKASGYRAACSTIPGAPTGPRDLFSLPRIDVTYGICRGPAGRFHEPLFATRLAGVFPGLIFRS